MTLPTYDTPIFGIKDMYSTMKQKAQNEARYVTYFSLLWDILLQMFTWEGLPDSIPERFIESILHQSGEVFIANINGELTASCGTLSGEVDAYGLGTECVAVCPVGEAHGKRNIDIAWGINNKTMTPDMLVYWIAHLLGEKDKSLNNNIIFSRFLNIPIVKDDKDKQKFVEILDKLKDGEVEAFASNNKLADELGNDALDVISLTDVDKSDRFQYLSRLHTDILKMFFNFYGQAIQNQDKSAQNVKDELHGMDSVSFIIPLQMLECRRELAENINRIFGTDISVDFSGCWKLEYNSFVLQDTNDNGIADIKAEADPDAEPEADPEADPEAEPEASILQKVADALETTVDELNELIGGDSDDTQN